MILREEITSLLKLAPNSFAASGIEAGLTIIFVLGIYLIFKNTISRFVRKIMAKSDHEFIVELSNSRLARNITLMIPFAFLFTLKDTFLNKTVSIIFEKTIFTSLVIVSTMLMFSLFSILTELSEKSPKVSERIPVRPFFQIIKMIIFLVAIVVLISNFVDKSPVYILSAVGAASAILMFIFKDTLQSFVASFQVTIHRSVKVGDWIEVPKYAVDGEVREINLNLISVKNWDNTTTVIPTYCLLTESFKNWTTMYKHGRRIKRAINININSIKQLSNEDIKKLKQVKLIKQYLEEKEADITIKNKEFENDELIAINGKKLTNIGTFRKYVEYYIKQHPDIIKSQLLIVRQLPNEAQGLPIEIYCFTDKTGLTDFEYVQSDIFDHLYSVVPLFGLNVYQKPSGLDFTTLSKDLSHLISTQK